MRRRLRLRSKPLARKAISSSTLLLSQHSRTRGEIDIWAGRKGRQETIRAQMTLGIFKFQSPPRARTPRARASPSRNNCDWNLNIPSVICARIVYRYMGWEERKARNDSRADDTGDIQIPIAIISTRACSRPWCPGPWRNQLHRTLTQQ
jgi:hypothetical protein